MTRLVLAACTAVLAEVAGIALAGTAAWLIVRASEQPPLAALSVAIVVVRALAVSRGCLRYVERLIGHSAVLWTLAELRGRVYEALVRRRDVREGDALTRVVSDVDAYQDALLRCLVPAIVATVVGIAGIAVTGSVALACGLVLMGIVLPVLSAMATRRAGERSAAARARLADHVVDLERGAQELAVYGATERKLREAEAAAKVLADAGRQTLPLGALAVIVHSGTVLGVLLTTEASAPARAAITLAVLAGLEVFVPLTAAAARWVEVRPSVERVRELLTGPSTPDRPAPELVPDKHIAVIGPSGAGKTTLLKAIARRYPDAAGAMADAHVFTTTVRTNLTFAREGITQADLDEVARVVRLDEWIASLPDGWDTEITAETISGGQRQRLILARAVLADAPILLLDEPVESLEPHQGDEILADTLARYRDRAVVLVTHRLAHIQDFEDVVTMANGEITGRGPAKMISPDPIESVV